MVFSLCSTARRLVPLCAVLALSVPSAASAQIFNFGIGFFSGCGLSPES